MFSCTDPFLFYIRAASSSLSDLEVKLNKAIERNVILGKELDTYSM